MNAHPGKGPFIGTMPRSASFFGAQPVEIAKLRSAVRMVHFNPSVVKLSEIRAGGKIKHHRKWEGSHDNLPERRIESNRLGSKLTYQTARAVAETRFHLVKEPHLRSEGYPLISRSLCHGGTPGDPEHCQCMLRSNSLTKNVIPGPRVGRANQRSSKRLLALPVKGVKQLASGRG